MKAAPGAGGNDGRSPRSARRRRDSLRHMSLDLPAAARLAEEAADAARREILPRFRRVAAQQKPDGSPVTEADHAAERAMRRVLRESGLPILGEEFGGEGEQAGERGWIVDPLDGTLAFSRGVPLFATLIALAWDGAPRLGLIDLPTLDERVLGWRGGGVRCNGRPLRASRRGGLAEALVACGDARCFDAFGARAVYDRLAAEAPQLRGYTDGFGHALALSGAVDVMVDVQLQPWDAAATQALAPEAGAQCITLDRRAAGRGLGLIVGSPALVERIAGWFEA